MSRSSRLNDCEEDGNFLGYIDPDQDAAEWQDEANKWLEFERTRKQKLSKRNEQKQAKDDGRPSIGG